MKKIKLVLVRSLIGQEDRLRRTVKSLGLGKLNSSVVHLDTKDIMGKIDQVKHLLKIEEVEK